MNGAAAEIVVVVAAIVVDYCLVMAAVLALRMLCSSRLVVTPDRLAVSFDRLYELP